MTKAQHEYIWSEWCKAVDKMHEIAARETHNIIEEITKYQDYCKQHAIAQELSRMLDEDREG